MPEGKVFLDTNIIVYAHDLSAGRKHEVALKTVLDLWNSGQGILSTQVLQEFFISVTRKIPKPIEIRGAQKIVEDLLEWEVIINDGDLILASIDLHVRYHCSFWDSMIIQAAIKGRASLLLSEDFSDGQTIRGVKIQNPFR
jgi:predicted nucleic acid-binding protein